MSKRSGIQLCYPLEERRLTDPKFGWVFPVICQPKLDGERARAVNEFEDNIDLLSSECNDVTGVPHINQLLEMIKRIIEDKGLEMPELDGELYCHQLSFEKIHSIVSRGIDNLHPNMLKIEYHVFDVITAELQAQRLTWLQEVLKTIVEGSAIKIVGFRMANNMDELMRIYNDYLDEGYEGIIVRHPFNKYVRKRSSFILKFKPKQSDLYEIIDMEQAISNDGTPLAMIGKFICKGDDGTEFSVGAGNLTHKQREFYWHNPDRAIGKMCLVQYQNLTEKSGKPRFGLCIKVVNNESINNDGESEAVAGEV